MNANPAANNPHWRANITALTLRDPGLAQRLEMVSITPDRFVAARANDGSPLLALRLTEQKTVALAHTNTPRKEAEEWVTGLGNSVLKNGNILLFGFGAGYHAEALFRLSDAETAVWIVEPDIAILKAAFHLLDLSTLIASRRVRFIVEYKEEEIVKILFAGSNGHRTRSQGIRLVFTGISSQLYGKIISRLSASIEETLQFEGMKFRTSELQGETILKNILANLPFVLQGAPVLRLQGICPGTPALVVGPGPSLDEAIPQIETAQNKAIIIAVDTAHRILFKRGIGTGLVVSLDFTELNARHFDTIESDDALLVAFPGIDPAISQKYAGRSFFYNHAGSIEYSPGATQFFNQLQSLHPLGALISYGSTAHAAYHLARLMGCSPIVLVGNDLAFPGSAWYAEGAMQNDLEQPDRETETLLNVPANDGGTVSTSGLYKLYLDSFGELIRGTGGVAINTSPLGARIDGCQWMTLDTVMARFLVHGPIDKRFLTHALDPDLQNSRLPLKHELAAIALESRRARKQLRRMSERLNELSPSAPMFGKELLQIMKTFVSLLGDERRALDLGAPLCSRSSLMLMGRLGDATLLSNNSSSSGQAIQDRLLEFIRDMDQALNLTAASVEHAGKRL